MTRRSTRAIPTTSTMSKIATVLLLLAFSQFVSSEAAFDEAAVDGILAAAQECRAQSHPALTVAVVKNGKTLLSRGYGVTGNHGNGKVTSSTRFSIASLSKAFTATLLLKVMEEDGRYNLTSKVRAILGANVHFSDEFRTKEATVEDLLSHKMAVPSNNWMRFDNNLTRANLKERLRFLDSPRAFRSVFMYSSLMYGLATQLTEVIAKDRWEALVTRHLFQPLAMDRSTFGSQVDWDDPTMAQGVADYNGTLKTTSHQLSRQWSELSGSGGIVSTADDMARWMKFQLSKGRNESGARVVGRTLMAELYRPRMAVSSNSYSLFQQPHVPATLSLDVYALGWRRGYYRGYPTLGHSGSTFGFSSFLTLVPSQNLGVFTAMTGSDPKYGFRGALHAYLLDELLGVPPWLNATSLCTFPEPWHAETGGRPVPTFGPRLPLNHPPSAYLGRYANPAYGELEVRPWDGGQGDEAREPSAHFTLYYGVGVWDLVKLPTHSPFSSSAFLAGHPTAESFYSKGRNLTAWTDYSPFIFRGPPTGSDVVVALSVPGFERSSPPVFKRVGHTTSSAGPSHAALSAGYWCLCFVFVFVTGLPLV